MGEHILHGYIDRASNICPFRTDSLYKISRVYHNGIGDPIPNRYCLPPARIAATMDQIFHLFWTKDGDEHLLVAYLLELRHLNGVEQFHNMCLARRISANQHIDPW